MKSLAMERSVRCEHAVQCFASSKQMRRARPVVCQAHTQHQPFTRRQLLQLWTAVAAGASALPAQPAFAGIERYVKKKKLDPLDTYVPLVLEARERLASLDTVMVTSPTTARQLLRSGPFSGLRDNIRALGEYAAVSSEQGRPTLAAKDAAQLVSGFFQALEDYDLVLYNAVREAKAAANQAERAAKDDATPVDEAIGLDKDTAVLKLQAAVEKLDSLIATVPADVLQKSQQVLDKVNQKQQVVGRVIS